MTSLVILKQQRAENRYAPEFNYLWSVCQAQARQVFDSVETIIVADDDTLATIKLEQADYVLLLGLENIQFTATSLHHMKDAIDQSGKIVVPPRLADFSFVKDRPIYTLREYEILEAKILSQGVQPHPPRRSHLPISLISGSAYDRHLSKFSVAEIFSQPDLLAETFASADWITGAGIYHQFIDYYGQTRDDILPYLPQHAHHILEVGCGRGLTGRLIQTQLGCRVTGVELNPVVAEEAKRHLWQVIVGDIQTVTLEHNTYDAVVATELFEHLVEPEIFLEKMKRALKPAGRIILSVPNVGHYAIVEDLLAGRWDYIPIGLLCYTHVRFFTRATIEAWLTRVGFETFHIIPQLTELPEHFLNLPDRLDVDIENLKTKGFYVIIDNA
ncbi:MAG: class I SAM-dependent methyltransferase [Anaerolineae bacterium]|nr:class I SAM-dependent methyltransferase [Anaerolineae bacterium]